MKKIGFIGAYDKTDLIVYIAKILVTLNKKVLVVDSTINQKARYIVPAINPTIKYVTDFEDIDIAVGFSNFEEIKGYLGVAEDQELEYDIALVDTDDTAGFESFELEAAGKNYFVTSFDNYSLKKGLEVLHRLKDIVSLTKILFSKEMLKEVGYNLAFTTEWGVVKPGMDKYALPRIRISDGNSLQTFIDSIS